MVKKIFTNLLIFVIAFAAISIAADIYYHGRVAHKDPGSKGEIAYSDFRVFWYAAHNFRKHILDKSLGSGDYPLYNKSQKFYHFRYSPFVALAMVPFGMIRHPATSLYVWYAFLNIVFLSSLLLLVKQFYSDSNSMNNGRYIILWVAFMGALRFYLMDIALGQTDVLIAFLFVLFLAAYAKNKEALCGIILALILQFKLLFLPMLAYFLFTRRKKLIASTSVAFVLFLFIPLPFLGLSKTVAFLKDWYAILGMSVPSQILNYKNQSITYGVSNLLLKIGAIKGVFASPKYLFYSISTVLLLSSYVIMAWFRKRADRRGEEKRKYLEVSLLIILSLVFSPIAWEAHFITLLIPLGVVIFFTINSVKRNALYIALGAFFILSCVIGTDLTKFIPGLGGIRFINIALGTVFLAFAAICGYQRTTT